MKLAHTIRVSVTTLACLIGYAANTQAQIDPDRLAQIGSRLAQIKANLEGLPEAQQQTLSSAAQNMLRLARSWDQVSAGLGAITGADVQSAANLTAGPTGRLPFGPNFAAVSDPASDFTYSLTTGFTQSETSTAWCGTQVVVGFNDSTSLFKSLLFGSGGASFASAGISSDRGLSFRDIGFINAGTDPNNFLQGDPVVTCVPGSNGTFYYTQIFGTGPASAPISAVAISQSTDGGATWANPVAVVGKDGFTHFLDKPWSAIDPTDPTRIFVTYTDFDSSGAVCGSSGGAAIQRTAIELVRSTDSGRTWSSPQVLVQACSKAPNYPSVQGSQVGLDPQGHVYIAWEDFSDPAGSTRDLKIRRSSDHGLTFGAAVLISPVTYTGDGFALQGGIRNNEFPLMAFGPAVNGVSPIYVVWNDGRNFRITDFAGAAGKYGFADVLLSKSFDGGGTWTPPIRVNSDPKSHSAAGRILGTDHFQPGIAADPTGAIGVCWYDRQADPLNYMIGRVCAASFDQGTSWTQIAFPQTWQPIHASDGFINPYYLGDYDSVASDASGANTGFLGAFGPVISGPGVLVPNQDVVAFLFPSASRR